MLSIHDQHAEYLPQAERVHLYPGPFEPDPPSWATLAGPAPTASLFLVEGIDGAGKSTLAEGLARSIPGGALVVHEPSRDTRVSASVSAMMADDATPMAEQFLLLAAAADTHHRVVRPALREGRTVILDRGFGSMHAYAAARGLRARLREIDALNAWATVTPRLVLWVETPVEVAQARLRARDGGNGSKFDLDPELQERVALEFQEQWFMDHRCEWARIDGTEDRNLMLAEAALEIDRARKKGA